MNTEPMRVMVTGGAGYVGSHFVRALQRAGHVPVVVDNLSGGHRDAVPDGIAFRQGSIESETFIRDVIAEHQVDAVAHFAARIQVGESVRDPRKYYRENLRGTMALLEAMLDSGVRTIVATSSAAVYKSEDWCCESRDDVAPSSPYGETKLAIEQMLASYERAYGLRYAALRCFNIAGAGPGLAERHDPETHLVPLVLRALASELPFTIYGDDYPTADGTAVRDYVHVEDVAAGHLAALERLRTGAAVGVVNLGSGVGCSVKEVIGMCRSVTGRQVRVAVGPRREGDPAVLVADIERARERLDWRPIRSTMYRIVVDAWEAQQGGSHGEQPRPDQRT
jgi:UDP-glucose 4-epimerase